jgi:molybdopterin/thiamine biosynthesis adenylyltransferase/rhodanese-related sulfurtransferase
MTPESYDIDHIDAQYDSRETFSPGERRDVEISPAEAKDLIGKDRSIHLVDIRPDWEARLGYIEGAVFIPVGTLEEGLNSRNLSRDTPVILYCSSGNRSLAAAGRLRENGYTSAHSVEGGYIAWLNAGYPVVTESEFTIEQLNRYSRQILLEEIGEEGQLRLLKTRILLVGAGGLGSPAGLYLAASGVGTLGIADFDAVDISNLNRQIFHGTDDVGKLKTASAQSAIRRLNPDVKVVTYEDRITAHNALEIIGNYDIVIDGADNVETKFLLNDACFFAGKPCIYGGAVQLEGQMSVFYPKGGGPCLRCLFPKPPPANLVPS